MLTVEHGHRPENEILDALHVAADVLGVDVCWFYGDSFHFRLPAGWTVSISPETAGRLRVETWWNLRLRDRKWVRSGDCNRLASLIRVARETALDPA